MSESGLAMVHLYNCTSSPAVLVHNVILKVLRGKRITSMLSVEF